MKFLTIVLNALLMCANLWAEEKKVELNKKAENQEKPNNTYRYEEEITISRSVGLEIQQF